MSTLPSLTLGPAVRAFNFSHGVSARYRVTGVLGALTSMVRTPFWPSSTVITSTFS